MCIYNTAKVNSNFKSGGTITAFTETKHVEHLSLTADTD